MLNYTDITQNTYVYPKLNGYGVNGHRKVWVLWCPRTLRRPWRNIRHAV